MKVLVTGTKSGLGKFLHEAIGGAGISRDTIIIHCAHKPVINADDFANNLRLTQDMLGIPHKKFIFMSSIDVFRKDSLNGKNKLDCEALVEERGLNTLIIRLPLILGKYQRPNCVSRIMAGEPKVTLSGESKFRYIYDAEILDYVKSAIEKDFTGIATIGSDEVKLKDLAKIYNPKVKFGTYVYNS